MANSIAGLVVILLMAAAPVLFYIYWRPIRKKQNRRKQGRVVERFDSDSGVSDRTVGRLTHAFDEDENKVYRATREDLYAIVPWSFIYLIIVAAMLGLAAYMITSLDNTHLSGVAEGTGDLNQAAGGGQSSQLDDVTINWAYVSVVPVLVALLSVFLVWNVWLRWRAKTWIITNKAVRLDFQASAWCWWLWNDEKHEPQTIQRIFNVEISSTSAGSIFGFGDVDLVVQAEDGGSKPNRLRYIPEHEEFKEQVDSLLAGIQREEEEGQQTERELLQATADNTAGIYRELRRLVPPDSGDQPTGEWPLPEPE